MGFFSPLLVGMYLGMYVPFVIAMAIVHRASAPTVVVAGTDLNKISRLSFDVQCVHRVNTREEGGMRRLDTPIVS